MKPELQRVKIAKACGWIKTIDDKWYQPPFFDVAQLRDMPLDYLNSLDAMAEVEKMLSDKETSQYLWNLNNVVNGSEKGELPWFEDYVKTFKVVIAPASARAEAFLRTKGLWEEGE